MRIYDIIAKKRDGQKLSDEEIAYFINGCVGGEIPDYQITALLMAMFLNKMDDEETAILTKYMAFSGNTLDLSQFGSLSVDKHSTGGVGDKTTLIVAPIVASFGAKVAKMSGRGLGHTGGTVDKLESISGYRIKMSGTEFLNQTEKIGICVVGQSENLVPADKKLYALRDVTATVNSIPLIASSIMSKKIASGAHSIVLDVKTGSGAFMKTAEESEKLAKQMVEIGKSFNRHVAAVITNMDVPLGNSVGNRIEVLEAVEILKGSGCENLRNICIEISALMLSLCFGWSIEESRIKAEKSISDNSAYNKFVEWITYQGGDLSSLSSVYDTPFYEVKSEAEGYIIETDSEKIGISAMVLGAGRKTKEDKIDFDAGIKILKSKGEYVNKGDTLCRFYSHDESSFSESKEIYLSAINFDREKPEKEPLIYKTIINKEV